MDLLPNPLPNLTVVGTGMKSVAHVTLEALEAVRRCDKLLHVGADVVTRRWLEEQNATAEALPNYLPGQPRSATYALWVERVLAEVRSGARVCAAAYGHPGMYVNFTGAAIRRARAEGFGAVMLPGISAEATLMSDLLVDPANVGWQGRAAARRPPATCQPPRGFRPSPPFASGQLQRREHQPQPPSAPATARGTRRCATPAPSPRPRACRWR